MWKKCVKAKKGQEIIFKKRLYNGSKGFGNEGFIEGYGGSYTMKVSQLSQIPRDLKLKL